MKYIFIVNPAAGKQNKILQYIPNVQKLCAKLKLDYIIHVSESGQGIRKYLRQACTDTSVEIRVYAIGGDGTLSHVVNGCVGFSHVEVGVIPLGTGNDFIRNFNGKIENFLDVERQMIATSQPVDAIRFREEYCINMLNMGLDANVGHDMPKFKKLPFVGNKGAYNLSLVTNLAKKLGRYIEIYGDDQLIYKGEVALCCVANGIACGGGFSLTPSAKIDDGYLDVAYVLVPKRILLPTIIGHVNKGTQYEELPTRNYMKTVRCKKVRIVSDKKVLLVNDGETSFLTDCTFTIEEKAIRFIQP